ncbi:unnamed protein product [Cochlearia groenlandica]
MHVLRKNREILENLSSDEEYFTVTCFPDKVEFTRPQVPVPTYVPEGEMRDLSEGIINADKSSYGVIVKVRKSMVHWDRFP